MPNFTRLGVRAVSSKRSLFGPFFSVSLSLIWFSLWLFFIRTRYVGNVFHNYCVNTFFLLGKGKVQIGQLLYCRWYCIPLLGFESTHDVAWGIFQLVLLSLIVFKNSYCCQCCKKRKYLPLRCVLQLQIPKAYLKLLQNNFLHRPEFWRSYAHILITNHKGHLPREAPNDWLTDWLIRSLTHSLTPGCINSHPKVLCLETWNFGSSFVSWRSCSLKRDFRNCTHKQEKGKVLFAWMRHYLAHSLTNQRSLS